MTSSASSLIMVLAVLVNVAFLTLMERKVLGLSQARLGPNKVAFMGLMQPVADAVKLFSKQECLPFKSNGVLFYVSPALSFILMLLVWQSLISVSGTISLSYGVVFVLVVMSLAVYPLMAMGWASNSKYAMIGALRGISQTVSYEICLALILLGVMAAQGTMGFKGMGAFNQLQSFLVLFPVVMVILFTASVAETNRTPFDFSEGESELVSGFNVEYSSGGFALIFMAEYGMILFFGALLSTVAWQTGAWSGSLVIGILILSGLWILLRATFPRYRYDKLMGLAWKSLLPISLGLLTLMVCQAV